MGEREAGAAEPRAGGGDSDPAEGDSSGLRRAITPTLLLVFIVGDILGGGIYALVGEVGAETGGAIWSAFILALIMAAFTAGSYAELVSKYPHAGGAALYANRAFGVRLLTLHRRLRRDRLRDHLGERPRPRLRRRLPEPSSSTSRW